MPSNAPQYVSIGRVGKPHGLDGSFFVEDASEESSRFDMDAVVFVEGESAIIVASKQSGGRPVINLDRRVERGCELTVPRAQLPALPEGSYYAFELIGLDVEEEGGRNLGRVREVTAGVANDVLELDSGVLLPMVEDCISLVDLERARIVVATGFSEPG